MKTRTLAGLVVLTIVVMAVIALTRTESETPIPRSGQLVFPSLAKQINDVAEIAVTSKDGQVTVVRGDTSWHVKEKNGYMAAMDKVRPVIIGVAELKYFEPKTKNPERYEKLGLLDPNAENATSKRLTLKDSKGEVLASLIVGNQRPARGNPRLSEIYIRKEDDPQAWLVLGTLPVETVAAEWLDQELWDIEQARIRRVQVRHADGETVTLEKTKPQDADFVLVGLSKGAKVTSQFTVNHMAATLGDLRLEDVKKAADVNFDKPDLTATLETFDGLRLTVHTAKHDKKHFVKAAVEFDPALVAKLDGDTSSEQRKTQPSEGSATNGDSAVERDEKDAETQKKTDDDQEAAVTNVKSPEEVKQEVALLQKKLNGWAFEVSEFRIENFAKRKKDLVSTSS